MEQLVYGPEIAVRGIVVNGQNVLPEEISRNYLELSAGEGYGSCPYLYAWSEGSGEWVRYGKVIHSAIGKAGKLTEEKRLYDFTDRVRLAEEELELSHIDRVTLKVRQAGGTVSTIAPRLPALTADDDVYVRIYAGQSIDVEFDIPDWLDRGTIEETSVVISG